jgi:hypothetical protein
VTPRTSRRLALACIVAATALSACGRTYSYHCTEQGCTASFQGPGELDLADARGPLIEVAGIGDGPSVTVRVDGTNATLLEDKPRRVEQWVLTLTGLQGENVTLRIVRR